MTCVDLVTPFYLPYFLNSFFLSLLPSLFLSFFFPLPYILPTYLPSFHPPLIPSLPSFYFVSKTNIQPIDSLSNDISLYTVRTYESLSLHERTYYCHSQYMKVQYSIIHTDIVHRGASYFFISS